MANVLSDYAPAAPLVEHSADTVVARLERLPFSGFHLRLASILGTGTFFDAFDSFSISVALTVIVSTFHTSFVQGGLLISAAAIGQFIGAIVFGALSERYGRRISFIVSCAIFGLLSLAAAAAANFESFFAIRLIQGLGLGAEVPVAGALFNEYMRGSNRGRVVMLYEAAFSVGVILTPVVGLIVFNLVGPALGWRVLFLIGVLPLFLAIYAYFKLPESVRWLASQGRVREADAIVSGIERDAIAHGTTLAAPDIRISAPVKRTRFSELFSRQYRLRTMLNWTHWFTVYFVNAGYTIWLPTLYVKLGGLRPDQALKLTIVMNVAQLTTVVLFALTVDRIGRKPWFIFGYATAAAGALLGFVFVTILHDHSWVPLFASGLLIAIGIFVSTTGLYLYTPELFPTRMRAWATSIGSSLNRLAAFIAPTIVGVMLGAKLGIGSVFLMFFGVLVVGLVVIAVFGIETKQRALEEIST